MYQIVHQSAKMFKLMLFLVFLVLSCTADPFEDECGLEGAYTAPLIKRGHAVKDHEFPWHVAIFVLRYNIFEVECGGSLVRNDLVITAAHCFTNESNVLRVNVSDYRVVAGSHLASWTSEETGKQTSEVRAIRLGEGYDGEARNYQADIAIIQLKNSFSLSDKVRAICLQLEGQNMDNWHKSPGLTGKVAGWGLNEWGIPSETLKFLTVPVIGDKECTNNMPATSRRSLLPDKVCAGLTNGSSVCKGDSGGGLVFLQNDLWYLRGVLSSAPRMERKATAQQACRKTTLALYTNLLMYSTWLSKNLKELHQPAYTRPGAACNTDESFGVCQEYLHCPTAVAEVKLGFHLTRCPNSDPARLVICCTSTQRISQSPVITSTYLAYDSNGQPVRVNSYRQKTPYAINRSPNVTETHLFINPSGDIV